MNMNNDRTNRIAMLLLAGGLLGGGLLGGGCQSIRQTEPRAALDPTPIPVDQAMQVRDWNQSVAWAANSKTVAGNVGFYWEPKPDISPYESGVIETPLFIANTVASPVSLIITPPWQAVVWDSGTVGPTYTAMPPMEGSQASNAASPPAHSKTGK
jgi:hypothetical protein